MSMIFVNNMSFKYANASEYLFENINITFDSTDKKIYKIDGKNGIGKTTFLKILAGILVPTSGNITIGEKKNSYNAFKQEIAYVPSEPKLYDSVNAYDYIDIIAELWNIKSNEYIKYKEKVLNILEKLDLQDLKLDVNMYSLGMVYKLYFALMIAKNPKVLLLDEPFTALDKSSKIIATQLIEDASNEMIIIYSSHQNEILSELDKKNVDLNKLKKEGLL